MILALVRYQFDKCKVVFSLVTFFVELSGTTSSEVVVFSTKFSNGTILGGISAIWLDRYCSKVCVAANCMKLGGVFAEFGCAYPNS